MQICEINKELVEFMIMAYAKQMSIITFL